ncbi:MAG: HAMP domain-containing sensor histidine kinase [Caulobacter sp.]|nr:HAMP domain-containing sensor histidine kinase [Caulobacter sp.]
MVDAPPPETEPSGTPGLPARRWLWPGGLSARLLVFTALFVAGAALFVLPAALAAFEEQWLLDRIRAAELTSTIADEEPGRKATAPVRQQLLDQTQIVSVVIQTEGMRRLIVPPPAGLRIAYSVDLRQQNPLRWLTAPFQTLFGSDNRLVRVIAEPRFRSGEFVEIITLDQPLKKALWGYLGRLVLITLFVSLLAGLAVYLTLNAFLVRPMQRITLAMERFRADPADPQARVTLSGRRDEIGRAEAELDRMQSDLVVALASRARLAALGEAVAKINHDLRNMLTSAQIASDRLAALGDPNVAQALPRLERALDRAVTLATEVLAYGKSNEAPPEAHPVPLADALAAAAEDAGLNEEGVRLDSEVGETETVLADPDQLHRILVNLMRNAREAIQDKDGRSGRVGVTLDRREGLDILHLSDDGPGLPEKALARLFQPFSGSARRGGTGLGLAISRELAQAHGGDLILLSSTPKGSTFELTLPAPVKPPIAPSRRKKAARA